MTGFALVEKIKRIYEWEQANPEEAARESRFPLSYEAVTPEWLTGTLCRNHPGAEVKSLTLGPPDNGSSNRRKMHLEYNQAGRDAGLPEKIFCKASHDLVNRVVLCTGALEGETFFYNNLAPMVDIEVPKCWFADYDRESFNSMIIMEDITDKVESFCTHETPMNMARAKSQVEQLAKFHAYFRTDRPEVAGIMSQLTAWPDFFDGTVENGMREGSNAGFLDGKEVIPAALYERYEEIWPKTVVAIEENRHLPNTLIHCDVHLKNWYVLPNDKMGLSDWQCCGVGHWGRDLAYTLGTALTVENRRAWEKELVTYYVEQMKANGWADITFDEAWHHYSKQFLTALTWWTVTLSPPEGYPDMQPRDITLEFIRRLTTAMEDLGTLDLF
jgi:thiamine kinase-like enzyme